MPLEDMEWYRLPVLETNNGVRVMAGPEIEYAFYAPLGVDSFTTVCETIKFYGQSGWQLITHDPKRDMYVFSRPLRESVKHPAFNDAA